MIRIDVQALTAAVFNRLASDAAGTAVRAALGAGGTSVVHAEQLKRYVPGAALPAPAPNRPLVALRRRPIPTVADTIHAAGFTWWVYDDAPEHAYWRINGLLKLLAAAYDFEVNRLSVAQCPISRVTIEAGDETSDTALGWLVCPVQLTIYC